jgi:hypothetical protein
LHYYYYHYYYYYYYYFYIVIIIISSAEQSPPLGVGRGGLAIKKLALPQSDRAEVTLSSLKRQVRVFVCSVVLGCHVLLSTTLR